MSRCLYIISLSVTTISSAKMAELLEMPFRMWTQVDPTNYVLDGGPNIPREGAPLRGMTSRFSHTLPSTVLNGRDIRISPHALDQLSDWSATEALQCHIKFSQ